MPTTADWQFRRALTRVEAVFEPLLAEHATNYCLRPVRRAEAAVPGGHAVVWSIDHETVAEFRVVEHGRGTLVVHDVSLLAPMRRAIRTFRVTVRLATDEERAATGSP